MIQGSHSWASPVESEAVKEAFALYANPSLLTVVTIRESITNSEMKKTRFIYTTDQHPAIRRARFCSSSSWDGTEGMRLNKITLLSELQRLE